MYGKSYTGIRDPVKLLLFFLLLYIRFVFNRFVGFLGVESENATLEQPNFKPEMLLLKLDDVIDPGSFAITGKEIKGNRTLRQGSVL